MARRTQLKVEIVTTEFNAFLRSLVALSPQREFKPVAQEVAFLVTRSALSKTRAAKSSSIRADHASKTFTTFNGKRYNLTWRYPAPLWRQLRQHRRQSLETKLNSRGLSKQSWLHVGNLLGRGLDVGANVPPYVRAANYKGKTYPFDANITEFGDGMQYQLTIHNNSPIVQAAGGRRALVGAMMGQARRFRTLMARKFYLTIATRAAQYPGIFATPSA